MKSVGLHFRVTSSLEALAQEVIMTQAPYAQFFLLPYGSRTYLDLEKSQVNTFINAIKQYAHAWFVHGSYFINLASDHRLFMHKMLKREIHYARKLQATYFVVHSGTHGRGKILMDGIDAVAWQINKISRELKDFTIVLENTAHGNRSIGSNLEDFREILKKLNHPEKVKFCIDTAHAFAYGYDISTVQGQGDFIRLIDGVVGIDRVALIHLNDISSACGSKLDHHHITGMGSIGKDALKHFIAHEQLMHVPCVLELPHISLEQQIDVMNEVNLWRTPYIKE
jgi:deoxyribonuclease-4